MLKIVFTITARLINKKQGTTPVAGKLRPSEQMRKEIESSIQHITSLLERLDRLPRRESMRPRLQTSHQHG